jgi:phage I-like protein
MHHPRRPTRLSLGTEPPAAFRLFPLGKIETTKGVFVLTPEDAARCVERQQAYGNELSIDYGHGVFEESAGAPQRAAGWIGGLEARPDGLWAVRVTWTEAAARMLKAREQRYHSPAFLADDDGHITEILNVALTLMPATHNLTPLVASRRSGRTKTLKRNNMEEKRINASELLKLADDIEKMGDGEDKEKIDLKALAERCRKLAEGSDEAPDSEKEEEEKASDDDEEKKTVSRIVAAAREATGERDASKVVGALKALGESQGVVATLTARVGELEANQRRARIEAAVKLAATPGPGCRIAPSEVASLVKWGMKDEEEMLTYLSKKPAHVAATAHTASTAKNGVALSAAELEVCKRAGIDPDKYAAQKAQNA